MSNDTHCKHFGTKQEILLVTIKKEVGMFEHTYTVNNI